jgi:hypothetical protein
MPHVPEGKVRWEKNLEGSLMIPWIFLFLGFDDIK